jgi:hypothetical protein
MLVDLSIFGQRLGLGLGTTDAGRYRRFAFPLAM